MSDQVLRAITDDGAFRAIVAYTTETVVGATAAQGATGEAARWFGELLTSTILVRETMAPQLRVQGIVRGAGGRGSLVADARPDGGNRGLVRLDGADAVGFGPGSMLTLMRSLPNGAIHQGIIDTSDHADMSQALMTYMQESEQVVCVAGVGTWASGPRMGGFVVQLLPEAERPIVMVMEQRLRELPPIHELLGQHETPKALLDELFFRIPFAVVGSSEVRYACGCSFERVLISMGTLPRQEIEDVVQKGEVLEVSCDYCGREYRVPPERLKGLLVAS